MSIAVIINPISGRARRETASARALIAAATIERLGERADIFITERAGHARELAAAAAAAGARLLVAWGGDGTINEVASALAFGQVPLGVIASGSGNGQGIDSYVTSTKTGGAQPSLTLNLFDWAAKLGANRSNLGSFSVAKYGPQQLTELRSLLHLALADTHQQAGGHQQADTHQQAGGHR